MRRGGSDAALRVTESLVLLTGAALSLALTSCTCARPRAASPADLAACRAEASARAVAAAVHRQPASAVRRQLEFEIARCGSPQADEKELERVALVNSNLAEAGRLYLTGKIEDRGYREAIDRNLMELCETASRVADPACRRAESPEPRPSPTPGNEPVGLTQLLDGVSFLFDSACDSSPAPLLSEPLAWRFGSMPGTLELSMTKASAGQAPDCDLLYELELRLSDPLLLHAPAGQPPPVQRAPVVHRGVLFHAKEDTATGDSRRAVFRLPGPVPTAERTRLAEELEVYRKVQWRVRALNGAQKTSGWSALRTQVSPFIE
jgi:hypothetical protein